MRLDLRSVDVGRNARSAWGFRPATKPTIGSIAGWLAADRWRFALPSGAGPTPIRRIEEDDHAASIAHSEVREAIAVEIPHRTWPRIPADRIALWTLKSAVAIAQHDAHRARAYADNQIKVAVAIEIADFTGAPHPPPTTYFCAA